MSRVDGREGGGGRIKDSEAREGRVEGRGIGKGRGRGKGDPVRYPSLQLGVKCIIICGQGHYGAALIIMNH